MSEHDNMESILRRIAKLLAIAEDPRANAAEASAAAGMAERVMRKFQLEHADVISAELKRGGDESFASTDVGSTLNPEGRSDEASGWAGILAVAVAKLHDCQARFVRTPKHGKTIRFSGYAADAAAARFTYVYLVGQMGQATKTFQATRDGGRAASEAFRRGFNSAVCALLRKATADKAREMQAASTSRELVLVKSNAVAHHFGGIKYKSAGGYRTGRGDAFGSGHAAGSRVDVGRRGISGGGSSSVLIGR